MKYIVFAIGSVICALASSVMLAVGLDPIGFSAVSLCLADMATNKYFNGRI